VVYLLDGCLLAALSRAGGSYLATSGRRIACSTAIRRWPLRELATAISPPRADGLSARQPSAGDVVTALARGGFRIEFLHEFPRAAAERFPLPELDDATLPAFFSVRAVNER
jgi:hypothetical protein